MRKKVLFNLRRPPEGLIKVHENKGLVRVEIRRQFYSNQRKQPNDSKPDKFIYNAILLLIKTVREK